MKKEVKMPEVKFPIAGKMIYWHFTKTSIEYAFAKEAAEKCGLPWLFRPNGMNYILTKLASEFKLRKIKKETADETWIALYDVLEADKDRLLETSRVIITVKDEKITKQFKDSTLQSRYEYWEKNLDTFKVLNYCVRWIESHEGFRVRPSGGIYFVPLEHEDFINSLSAWFDMTQVGKLYTIAVALENETIQTLLYELSETLKFNLAKIEQDIKRVNPEKEKSIKRITEHILHIKNLIDNYSKRFAHSVSSEIINKLNALEMDLNRIRRKVDFSIVSTETKEVKRKRGRPRKEDRVVEEPKKKRERSKQNPVIEEEDLFEDDDLDL